MSFWTFRRAASAVAVLIVLLTLGWAAVVVAVAVTANREQVGTADAIVVLGAAQYNGRPSPVFRARLDHAAALYTRGYSPLILVTGGVGRGDTLSEAEVGERFLVQLGLPREAVVALPPARNTYQALQAVAVWFEGRESRRALFVSDGFHMLRIRIVASRLELIPFTSAAPGSPIHASVRRNLTFTMAEGLKVPLAWLFQH
jgi:uncharacterized SAM-binding protein YcdF (DUF218 family)